MDLYNRNSGSAGIGMEMAGRLHETEMMQRQKMAPPVGGDRMSLPSDAPSWYNPNGMMPAKYSVPSDLKERMVARAAVREAAQEVGTAAVPRPDAITDAEVDYVQIMDRQAKLADFDRYINTLVDVRKPGNLKWLMEVYPEFVHRRVAQVHDDYDFAIRKQMIENWGVNTFDDLHFMYLCDQGKIDGPTLSKREAKDWQYKTGILSPLAWHQNREGKGVKLPFASASIGGPMSGNPESWTQSDAGQPLGRDRDLTSLARQVMQLNPGNAPGGGEGGIKGTAPKGGFGY